MEGQQRANAAQLAARNIKQAKGRQRKTPLKTNGSVQQSMQFGGGGGIFGGIAPPTGSFDFSAPSGLSFPPPAFGNGNTSAFSSPEVSENEGDYRPDPTGEESLRRGRAFQTADGPALFQTPDSFGGVQNNNTNIFGQASKEEKSAENLFSFKPPSSQPTSPSLFNFNSNSTASPASNPFAFQQTISSAPAQPAINFGATPSQDKPAANPFSFLAQPAPATSQPAQEKPANNIFGGLSQTAAPSSPFNFGAPAPQDKPAPTTTPFVFGQSSAKPPSSADSAAAPAAEKPANNLFGNPQQTSAPAGSGFNFSQAQPAKTNIFGNTTFSPSPAGGLFGNQNSAQTSSNLFGEQGKQQKAISTSNDAEPKPSTAADSKPQHGPPANIFGNAGKVETAAPGFFGNSSKQVAPTTNLFAGLNTQPTPTSDLFGNLNKPVQPSLAQPSGNALTNGANSQKESAPSTAEAPSKSLFGQAPSANANGSATSLFSAPSSSKPTFPPSTPAVSFGAATSTATAPATSNNGSNTLFSLNKPVDAPKNAGQAPASGIFTSLSQPSPIPPKTDIAPPKATPSTQSLSSNGFGKAPSLSPDTSNLYRDMAAAARITEEVMRPLVPARFTDEQRKEFYVAYRMRGLNKAMQGFFTNLSMGSEVSNALAFYEEQRLVILGGKAARTKDSKGEVQAGEQQSASIFSPNKVFPPSESQPTKSQAGMSFQKPADSGSQLFGTASPMPAFAPAPAVAASPSSAKGKRKAEVQLTKDDEEKTTTERGLKTPKFNGVPAGGSNTSNIFKNIVDSPVEKGLEKKVKSLPATSGDDAPRVNPFAALPLPASTTPKTTAPTIFAKPAAQTSNPFQPKMSSVASNTNATGPTQGAIKPPTFGSGPVNFMAQFNQQASKSEEKLMEEAKAEDMDSDDDEAEWEAKWKAKRKAELQAIEEIGKSKRASFTGGKFSFGQGTKADAPTGPASPEKSSVSGSAIESRTPTPGIVGSSPGSVLDGHVPGKPATFGQNIFGHLSDADSGADSRNGGAQESDSPDEETENEEDSENKDPSYKPGSQQSSSRTSPEEAGQGPVPAKKPLFDSGVPKTAGFSGTAPNSGTSTPGGSLFDRITRDSSGNPIRHVSSEEKENAKPSSTTNVVNTTNPFARSFDGAPADQTWKPDTPIKFGPPTVNVTAATPTKQPSPFSNLFGNSPSSDQSSSGAGTPKPTSNLFAGLATSKPSGSGVGFNFGSGLSTTTSSLFPSAAVSATTSRATSPGGTTDGDSAAEGEPDGESYQQINLAASGPGEEHEEVLHEIRAKALQWSTKDGAKWQTMGVGPLRVLKHKETGSTRLLLRADPLGTVVLNRALLAGVKYEVTEKTIKFPAAGEQGKGLETWLLQLKTPEFAQALGKVMEDNKPSS